MSKPVKDLVRKELIRRFEGLTSLAVVGFSGLDGKETNAIRGRLLEKDIRVTVVKNSLAKQAFQAIGLETAGGLLDGPCAVAYGANNVVAVVRELLAIHKEYPSLTVKAAVLEGEPFGEDQIDALSRFPTRDEALGRLVACVLAPGAKLAACLLGPGATIASILKTIEDEASESEGGGEPAPEPGAAPPAEAAPEEAAPEEAVPAEAPPAEAPPAEATPAEAPPAEAAPEEAPPAEAAPAEAAPAEATPAEAPPAGAAAEEAEPAEAAPEETNPAPPDGGEGDEAKPE